MKKNIKEKSLDDADMEFLLNQAKLVNNKSIADTEFIKNLPTWFVFNTADKS